MNDRLENSSEIQRIMEIAHGYWHSSCLLAANELGIFNVLSPGPKNALEISQAIGGDLRATTILLNALVALALLEKKGERYRNMPATERFLVEGKPEAITNLLSHSYEIWDAWRNLVEVVRRGSPEINWEENFLQQNRNRVAHFIRAMDEVGAASARELAKRLDLSRVNRLLDAAGGAGTYTYAMIRENPNIKATIFDLPLPLEVAQEYVKKNHMTDKVELKKGDLLKDPLGEGYDLILFSQILHAYSPEENKEFLRKGYKALNPGGQMVVHDYPVDESKTAPLQAAIFSVNMLVNTQGGAAYSINEFIQWLTEVGLREIKTEDILGRSMAFIGYK